MAPPTRQLDIAGIKEQILELISPNQTTFGFVGKAGNWICKGQAAGVTNLDAGISPEGYF